MGRSFVGKKATTPSPARVVLAIFVMILVFALIADFFWAFSSKLTSSYLNIASNWSPHHTSILLPNNSPQKVSSLSYLIALNSLSHWCNRVMVLLLLDGCVLFCCLVQLGV